MPSDRDPERSVASPGGIRQPRVVLATCRRWPSLSPSDQCYARALQDIGAHVTAAAWNSEHDQPEFRAADAVVIRASWDYHDSVDTYRSWLARLAAENVKILNDVALVTRFLDKKAFTKLGGEEVITPRCLTCPANSEAIAEILSAEVWQQAVLKPMNGASGRECTSSHRLR